MEKSSWSKITAGKVQKQPVSERDRTYHDLQDMFNQIDGEVVYMVLQESDWKAEDAVEKLLQMSQGNVGGHYPQHQPGLTLKSVAQTITNGNRNRPGQQGHPHRTMNSTQQELQLDLKSRLPSVSNQEEGYTDGVLPVLSPRTPGTAGTGEINFPNFPQDQTNNSSFRTALNALDSYANNTYSYGTAFNNEGGSSSFGAVWDFSSATSGFDFSANSTGIPNIPPPPLNDTDMVNYNDLAANPFSTLPGLNNFVMPATSSNINVTEPPPLYSLATTSSAMLRSNSPRNSHNNVFSENSYNSPNRLSSVSSGLPSPFTPLNNIAPDFSTNIPSSAGQTPSRQSSSGSNDGPPQPLPAPTDALPQRPRNYNMSLNATERESLEKLIEEVIIGGVDQGFVDSEGTSSEDETGDSKKVKKDSDSSGKDSSKPKEGKLYGSQMKVAAKHMKNLPPRFARRIQAAQKHADTNAAVVAEKNVLILEDEKKPRQRKRAGGLLEGIDSYFDEDDGPVDQLSPRAGQDTTNISELFEGQTTPEALKNLMLGDLSSLATPPLVPSPKISSQDRTPNSQVLSNQVPQHTSAIMNCEELEREQFTSQSRDSTPGQLVHNQFTEPPQIHRLTQMNKTPQVIHSEQYMSLSEADRQKLSGFSVNAPEFVPRSVTPTTFAVSQAQHAAPPPPQMAQNTINTMIAPPTQIPISSMSMPQVKLMEGKPVMAPIANQVFQHPPPPTKVPMNRSSPFHVPLGRMSPQLIPHVTAQGRHSPTPAFILPKQAAVNPTQSTAVAQAHAAAAMQSGHAAVPGMIPYPQGPYAVAFPAPPPPPPPTRYAHYAYAPRPPFLPPGAPYPAAWTDKAPPPVDKMPGRTGVHKVGSKEKLWNQGPVYSNVHAPVSSHNARVAANFQPNTVLSRGTKLNKNEASKQQHLIHNKEGAALVAASGSPLSLSMEKPLQKVERLVKEGHNVMVIMRGLPGSGKSTMAREMKKEGIVLTSDDFFIDESGQYKFDYAKLGDAHEFNQKRAKLAVNSKINPIIVDNTHTQQWEMKYYVTLAQKANYHVEILEPDTPWKFKPKECFKKNKHNVSLEHIQRMADRYEHNITVESILKTTEKVKEEVKDSQQQAALQPGQAQNQTTDDQAAPPKKSTRKRKRRKKKKNKDLKDQDGEKIEGKDDKEGASSDEDESTPDREHQVNKENKSVAKSDLVKEEETNATCCKADEKDASSENKVDKKVSGNSASVIENETSQLNEENVNSVKEDLSNEIDLINNNNSKKELMSASPQPENANNENSEKLPDLKPDEISAEEEVKTVEKTETVRSSSSSSEEGSGNKDALLPSRITTLKNCDASEEDNAVSGTDSGGVSTPLQRRHSEIHLSEPAMLKEAIESSLKEVLSSAGSDSETQEELAAALRRKLYQRQVSETLICEIEEIIKEKILENIINDEVAAITEHVDGSTKCKVTNVLTEVINSTEEAYWKKGEDNKQDRYVVSVENNDVVPTELTWTGKSTDQSWEKPSADDGASSNKLTNINTPSDVKPASQRHPRSPRKRQADLVKLESDVKEQLTNSEWQMPSFATEDVAVESTTLQEIKGNTTVTVGTFTHPKDFSNIQRLFSEDLKITEEDEFTRMIDTQPRIISIGAIAVERPNTKVLMLDKGCMVEEQTDNSEGVNFLQKCFPSVDVSDLEEVLMRCEGDLQWATNILLDSPLEYNEPTRPAPDAASGLDTAVRAFELSATSVLEAVSPPPLAVLCHASLPASTELSSNNVQQTFVHGSVRRLQSIEEFKRQHSIPSESHDGVESAAAARKGDTSVVNPCSPGGTLKDEVFETLFRNKNSRSRTTSAAKRTLSHSPTLDEEDHGSSVDGRPPDSPAGRDEMDGQPPAFSASATGVPIDFDEAIEEELKEVTTEVDVSLELPHNLAKQLIRMFGPVAFHISPDSLSEEDLTVRFNRGMAKRLHHCWASSLREKFAREEQSIQSMIEQDEALAKRLQEEEDMRHLRELTPSRPLVAIGGGKASPARSSASASPSRTPALGKLGATAESSGSNASLRDIMNEEAALEASKKSYLQEHCAGVADQEVSIATRLKRQKLQEIFPDIDTATLEEIFQSNEYMLGETVSAINAFMGKVEPARDVMTDGAIAAYEEKLVKQAQEESLRLQERQMAAVVASAEQEEEDYQTLDDPGYQDFRAETSIHYKLRKECFQKAQEAYRRGLKQVASFYSQQGHLHTLKLKEANRRAAAKIIELKNEEISANNKVDLHGLHVDEALEVLTELLCKKEQDLKRRKDTRKQWFFVVTGRGTHSQGGRARIKPAVFDYLNRNKYTFAEVQPGMLKVQLKNRE